MQGVSFQMPPGGQNSRAVDSEIKAAHLARKPVLHGAVFLAARCPAPGHRGKGALRSRRKRSAAPTRDRAATGKVLAPVEESGSNRLTGAAGGLRGSGGAAGLKISGTD